jgi:hypothetical protein
MTAPTSIISLIFLEFKIIIQKKISSYIEIALGGPKSRPSPTFLIFAISLSNVIR